MQNRRETRHLIFVESACVRLVSHGAGVSSSALARIGTLGLSATGRMEVQLTAACGPSGGRERQKALRLRGAGEERNEQRVTGPVCQLRTP